MKEGPLSTDAAGLLAHLETYRELGDCVSAARFTGEQAQAEIARAEKFIDACRPLLSLG